MALIRSAGCIAIVASLCGLTGCIVDFDTQQENAFSCTSDTDCLGQSTCIIADGEEYGYCGRAAAVNNGGDCVDLDGDGWGEGSTCRGPDCNDNDPDVNPGQLEICDGKDNDCDCVLDEEDCDGDGCEVVAALADCPLDLIDEPTQCEEDADCGALADVDADNGMRCVFGGCQYRCPLDNVGACAMAGPDNGGAVVACQTIRDEVTGEVSGGVPLCGTAGAYGDGVGPGAPELCDMIDNACNGTVDDEEECERETCNDGDVKECGTDTGICRTGIMNCVDGQFENVCRDAETGDEIPQPNDVAETCNGLDDNCNGDVDEQQDGAPGSLCPDGCPFGTVVVRGADSLQDFCIDRYEASRVDATATDPGTESVRAVSRPGVLPWTNLSLTEARDACRGQGAGRGFVQKRLCSLREVQYSCGGVNASQYPYGPMYNATVCNGAGSGLGMAAPTGPTPEVGDMDFAACTAERGDAIIYDLSGNVAEFVLDNNLGKIYGGSYESGQAELTCQSALDGQSPDPSIGFRCCVAPQ